MAEEAANQASQQSSSIFGSENDSYEVSHHSSRGRRNFLEERAEKSRWFNKADPNFWRKKSAMEHEGDALWTMDRGINMPLVRRVLIGGQQEELKED